MSSAKQKKGKTKGEASGHQVQYDEYGRPYVPQFESYGEQSAGQYAGQYSGYQGWPVDNTGKTSVPRQTSSLIV